MQCAVHMHNDKNYLFDCSWYHHVQMCRFEVLWFYHPGYSIFATDQFLNTDGFNIKAKHNSTIASYSWAWELRIDNITKSGCTDAKC